MIVALCSILAYRYRTYHNIKVVKTISKDLTESFQSFSYKKGTICYSEDGIYFLDGKGNENGIAHIQLKIHKHPIVEIIL